MARKSKHKNVAGTMNDIDCLNNTGQPELQITPDLTRLLNVLRTRRLITILLALRRYSCPTHDKVRKES